MTSIDDTHMSVEASMSPVVEDSSCESSDSDQETTPSARKSSGIKPKSSCSGMTLESHTIDPMEGTSWMHDSLLEIEEEDEESALNNGAVLTSSEEERSSPVCSLPERRRSASGAGYFRVPELPKPMMTRLNLNNEFDALPGGNLPSVNGLDATNG